MRARDNPFAAGRFDRVRFRFPSGDTMEALLERLREHGMRGAIVGPEGHGKSTILRELEKRLGARECGTPADIARDARPTLFRLREGERSLPGDLDAWLRTAGEEEVLLLDSVEQLSAWSWLVLRFRTRRLRAFVVTSHRDGRLPTVLRCRTSPALLEELLDELAPDRPPGFPSPEELWNRHRGDVRQALFDAYDSWE